MYQVIVNGREVCKTSSPNIAHSAFDQLAERAERGIGRLSGAHITLLVDGDPVYVFDAQN